MVNSEIRGFDRLKKVIIKWGYGCNNDCIFCHCSDNRHYKPISENEILKKIDTASRLGVKVILFSGGEPLLIKGLPQIMRYALTKGMYSGLVTNGRLLISLERLKELYKVGLRYIYMSITSLDPRVYAMTTGVNRLRDSIIGILNILKFEDIFFTTNIPILNQNISTVTETAIKLSLLGVQNIKLSVLEPKGLALRNYRQVVPPLSQSATIIAKTIEEVEKNGAVSNIFHDGLPFCLSPDYLKYNRDLFSENILYMSEAYEKQFYKTDYKNRSFVKGVCSLCRKRKICSGIYTGYIENRDIPIIPIKEGETRRKSHKPNNKEFALMENKGYEVNIGKLCNNSCIFCANGKISKEENRFVEYEKIIAEIEKAKRDGFTSLGFLGGEITIHPDLFKIIRYAKGRGIERIAICTNGRRLNDIEFTKRLIEAGVTRFMISIHSHREEIENYLNKRKNAYNEKIAGIKNLISISRSIKIPHGISLNTCIHGLNYSELIELASFFKGLGINDIRFNFIRPENEAEYDKKIIPSMSEVRDYVCRLIDWNESYGEMHLSIGDIPFCLLPKNLLSDINLLKKYCGEFRDFDTFVTTFRTRTDPDFIDRFSWRKRKIDTLKTKSPLCIKCIYDSICEGLFKKYINLYGISELHPILKLK